MFTIEKLPGEAITIITFDGSILKDMVSPNREARRRKIQSIVEETPGLDYLVMDFQGVEISFSQLVMVLAEARDQMAKMGGKIYIDANIRYLFVGSDELIDLAAEAFHQEQYGNIDVRVFPTVESAVSFARHALAGESRPTMAG